MGGSGSKPIAEDSLENDVTCPICMEVYKLPKILSCGHTYCRDCIQSCLKSQLQGFSCPLCKKDINLHTTSIDDLPTNYTVVSLIDSLSKYQVKFSRKPALCIKHRKVPENICVNCQDFLCSKCIKELMENGEHAGHKIEDLDDALECRNKELEKSKSEIDEIHKTFVAQHVMKINEFQKIMEALRSEINKDADLAITKINANRAEHLAKLNKASDDAIGSFQNLMNDVEQSVAAYNHEVTNVVQTNSTLNIEALTSKTTYFKRILTEFDTNKHLPKVEMSSETFIKLGEVHIENIRRPPQQLLSEIEPNLSNFTTNDSDTDVKSDASKNDHKTKERTEGDGASASLGVKPVVTRWALEEILDQFMLFWEPLLMPLQRKIAIFKRKEEITQHQ